MQTSGLTTQPNITPYHTTLPYPVQTLAHVCHLHYLNPNRMTTHTTQAYIPSSRSGINLIILQVNIPGIKINSRSTNCLFTTYMNISSQLRKTSSLLKQKFQNTYITTVRTDINSITFITTDIPSTIITHSTELLTVKIHINTSLWQTFIHFL